MPVVKIETRRGLPAETKRLLLEGVHQAIVTAFKIPANDRIQRIVEYAPEDFEIPPGKGPRFMLVQIICFAGRSLAAKRTLYREVVRRFEALDIPAGDVFIVLSEEPRDNWGLRGGQAATDLDLGFEIQV